MQTRKGNKKHMKYTHKLYFRNLLTTSILHIPVFLYEKRVETLRESMRSSTTNAPIFYDQSTIHSLDLTSPATLQSAIHFFCNKISFATGKQ